MGTIYKFECSNCDYSVEVSGSNDMGMLFKTTTILCKDCKELYDVVTKYHREDKEQKLICPKNINHNIRRWEHPDICPVCGKKLKKDEFSMILWD